MSVTLLSSVTAPDSDDTEITLPSDPAPFAHDKFDKLFESAWEKIEPTLDQPPRSRKNLDQIIGDELDRAEAKQADAAEFKASREARSEMNRRYGDQGDIGETLNRFISVAGALKNDPTTTALSLAESYLKTAHSLPPAKEKPPMPAVDIDEKTGRRETGRRLNAILDDAIENAGAEAKDFEGTKEQRAALRKIFPNMSFSQAMEAVVSIDTELRADPITGAARLAAAAGMPVLPHQIEQQNHVDNIASAIDPVMRQEGFNDQAVMSVLARPEFVRTGDHVADLARANQVVQKLAENDATINAHAAQQLQQMSPAMAEEVLRVIHHDPQFREQAARLAASRPFGDISVAYTNLEVAKSIAMASLRNPAAVAKAQRAARLKRSSGRTPSGSSSGGGIDGAIERALRNYE